MKPQPDDYEICRKEADWLSQLPQDLMVIAIDEYNAFDERNRDRWTRLRGNKEGIELFVIDRIESVERKLDVTVIPYITFERLRRERER